MIISDTTNISFETVSEGFLREQRFATLKNEIEMHLYVSSSMLEGGFM